MPFTRSDELFTIFYLILEEMILLLRFMGQTKVIQWREVFFQLILNPLVLIFFSVNRPHPEISLAEICFFLNYAAATFLINYWLLGRYFYRRQYWRFAIGVITILVGVVLIEELVLEKIFYPDTWGSVFRGFYALLGVLPVITVLTGFKFGWDALIKQREVDELKATIQESELRYLQNQTNPHFLFNNLNNLYSYALEQSPKTPGIILELSSVLRYMLYECRERYVPLQKEIEQLRNFTRLNEMQIEERGVIKFSAPQQTYGYQIAPLILLAFIENAFKHSQTGQSDGIKIDIDISLNEAGRLTFSCRNNFGENSAPETSAKGIGLANVRKRLQLLYPDRHELDIQRSGGFYAVRLDLQLGKKALA